MIYISVLFKERYHQINKEIARFTEVKEIPNTNDIWIRDFMPIKNTDQEWVLFRYFPKYLSNPKYHSLITDNRSICVEQNIAYTYSDIILDGGSVVYKDGLYFVSERILLDNPSWNKTQLHKALEILLKTDNIIFLPEAPNDFTGHLDGIMTILDDKTILINDYQDEYREKIFNRLKGHNFNLETIPYNPYANKSYQSAQGIYINYIKTENYIFAPIFEKKEDELALTKIERIYPKHKVIPILCNKLALQGGILHCVSWQD